MIRRRPVRSNSSMRGWSTSSWIIVGTSRTSVTPSSLIAVITATGSNIGIIDVGAAAHELAVQAARSARWNIGAACR